MNGAICGWLDRQQGDPEIINKMLRGIAGFPEGENSSLANGNSAVGARGRGTSRALFQSDNLYTAIEGNPHWQDRALSELAASSGDAHALAEGYRQYGKAVLERIHGDFALGILEPRRGYALLAIDRVGIRPLAYTSLHDKLVFGSQISSVLSHPDVQSQVTRQGVFDYLYFHMVPSPVTIFSGIHKLEPAECLEYHNGTAKRTKYWHLQFSEAAEKEADLGAELREQLTESVAACLDDQPTGTFLSGGLDSSTVTGVFQALSKKPVEAFAIGFDAEGFDEMEYARASARHFGVSLHEYYVTPKDVLEALPAIAAAYDEPFGNASAIPAYYCAKFARQNGIQTLLAGDGGDEIFGGNARYAKQKLFDVYHRIPGILRKLVVDPLARDLGPLRKLKSYVEQARVPMPARMETYNFLHRTPLTEIFDTEFLSAIDSEAPAAYLDQRYGEAGAESLLKKMLFLDHKITLSDNDLRKVNRMCELAGVEVRYPLLQDNMMEFAAKVPSNMLLKGMELRSFYRHALKDFLAPETLSKDKHGFGLPFGLWINEYAPLQEFTDDNLKKIRERGFLKDSYIETLIKAHQSGHASYYGVMIWILIMLEQWLESHEVDIQ